MSGGGRWEGGRADGRIARLGGNIRGKLRIQHYHLSIRTCRGGLGNHHGTLPAAIAARIAESRKGLKPYEAFGVWVQGRASFPQEGRAGGMGIMTCEAIEFLSKIEGREGREEGFFSA